MISLQRIVSLVCVAAAIAGCGRATDHDEEAASEVTPVVNVAVAPVARGTIVDNVACTGAVQSLHVQRVRATLTGRIVMLNTRVGDAVHKGDVIATIRTKEADAAIAGARTLHERATDSAARADAARTVALAEQGATAARIVAPFDGLVTQRFVNPDEFVNEGTDLLELVDSRALYFLADVPADVVPRLRVGQAARITLAAGPAAPVGGRVEAISPELDPASQMCKVRIAVAADAVKVGAYGSAAITVGEHTHAQLVPRTAVIRDNETGVTTIAVAEDSIARILVVRVGLVDSTRAEILSPQLDPAARVIVTGNYGLQDSTKITIAPSGEAQ